MKFTHEPQYVNDAHDQEYGETIKREIQGEFSAPENFEESALSISKGAETVYREDTPTDSVQIRVYEDKITLQRDRYNPEYHPIKHATHDAPGYTLLAAAGGLGLAALASGG